MQIGLMLGLGSSTAASAVFDPTTIPSLTALYRDYTGSPWVPAAGAAGNASSAFAPLVGTAVNGHTPALTGPATDRLSTTNAAGSFVAVGSYTVWALVKVATIVTNDAGINSNEPIFQNFTDGCLVMGLRAAGPNHVYLAQQGSPTAEVSTAITTGAWQLIQGKYNGSTMKLRINGGTRASAAATNLLAGITTGFSIFRNGFTNAIMDGQCLELGFCNTALSDADEDNILTYARTRYALALT